MRINHNYCIKLVRLVIFIYDARSHIHQNYVNTFQRDFAISAETSAHKMVRSWLHRYCTFAYCVNVAVWSPWKNWLRNLSLDRSAR